MTELIEEVYERTGISRSALKKLVRSGVDPKKLRLLISSETTHLVNEIHKFDFGEDTWTTEGKRYIQLQEAMEVRDALTRWNSWPNSRHAIILSGSTVEKACVPWGLIKIAHNFTAFEINHKTFQRSKRHLKLREKILQEWLDEYALGEPESVSIDLIQQDCLESNSFTINFPEGSSVIDLDFCSNRLRLEEDRLKILNLILNNFPESGSLIFRTTLHVGRSGNSICDVKEDIDLFEELLIYNGLRFQHMTKKRYQSTLPMLSVLYILERKEN